MSQENVEIVRRAAEAAWRKPKPDFATINALFDPAHELVSMASLRGPGLPGAGGFREWLAEMDEAYESWEGRVEQARAIDRTRVLLTYVFTIEGKQSGVPYEQRMGAVMTVQDGKIARTETYASPEGALEAVGLSE